MNIHPAAPDSLTGRVGPARSHDEASRLRLRRPSNSSSLIISRDQVSSSAALLWPSSARPISDSLVCLDGLGRRQIANHKAEEATSKITLLSSASKQARPSSKSASLSGNNNPARCAYSIFRTLLLVLALSLSFGQDKTLLVDAIKLQPDHPVKHSWSGEQFVVTCQNNNNIKNVKIRWLAPSGLEVADDKSQRVHTDSFGQHGSRLVIMNATTSIDDGQYKCILGASGQGPKEMANFTVRVHQSPSFRDAEPLIQLQAGRSGIINCRIDFDSSLHELSVSWLKDGMDVDTRKDKAYRVIEYDNERKYAQLQVSPVARHHDGVYTCRAMVYNSDVSKVSDHNTLLEVQFAPTFDKQSETVWVARASGSMGGASGAWSQRDGHSNSAPRQSHLGRQRNQQEKALAAAASQQQSNRYQALGSSETSHQHQHQQQQQHQHQQATGGGGELTTAAALASQRVKVELKCACNANPNASIVWTSSSNGNYILSRGQPAHIVEEPRTDFLPGHQTVSTLIVEYQLDANWPHQRDQYTCSATNSFGQASKRFDIKQGDPAPGLQIAAQRQYNPLNGQFNFTLIGIDMPPLDDSGAALGGGGGSKESIVPPIDMLRIRTDDFKQEPSGTSNQDFSQQHQHQLQQQHAQQVNKSVEFALDRPLGSRSDLISPRVFNVSLARMPSGSQKLYLEAHNAVGWSSHPTLLGEFSLVNGVSAGNLLLGYQQLSLIMAATLVQLANQVLQRLGTGNYNR